MAFLKLAVLIAGGKKGLHALHLKVHLDMGLKQKLQSVKRGCDLRIAVPGGSYGGKEVGVSRRNGVFLVQLQGADKGSLKLREKMKRAAQKCHMAPDRFAAGQAADSLVDHGLKNRSGQVFFCRSLVDQWLDI
ncbi:hypothetical protein IMSAGC007_04837 [Lachnospiraceae bacterium]|nr:hypothetical protein IMSAGC007_04837 [Lachnospiraceae bacterium]